MNLGLSANMKRMVVADSVEKPRQLLVTKVHFGVTKLKGWTLSISRLSSSMSKFYYSFLKVLSQISLISINSTKFLRDP